MAHYVIARDVVFLPKGRLDIDGMGMLLAQGLVLLGVERLALQVNVAHRTNKAGVVPSMAEGFDELVAGLHREVTAVALGAEKGDVIFLAVRLPVLHVEQAVSEGLPTGSAHKTGGVPGLPQRMHHFPHDLGVAAGTGGGEVLAVAVLAVHVVLLLHEADVSQRGVAVVAVELLRVPGAAQGHQERSSEEDREAWGQEQTDQTNQPQSHRLDI